MGSGVAGVQELQELENEKIGDSDMKGLGDRSTGDRDRIPALGTLDCKLSAFSLC